MREEIHSLRKELQEANQEKIAAETERNAVKLFAKDTVSINEKLIIELGQQLNNVNFRKLCNEISFDTKILNNDK